MANNVSRSAGTLGAARAIVWAYVAVVLGTIVALVVLSRTSPHLATSEAWGHAVIVAVFAVLLPLRMRAAGRGNAGAVRAVGIIAAVLTVVNIVEACLPAFPAWMRVEMVVIAAMMLAVVACVVATVRRRVV
ncbi:MAG TPA: hypothetical protein VGN37_25355 [Actinocatenispora sp.]